jgi:hypothetical protein
MKRIVAWTAAGVLAAGTLFAGGLALAGSGGDGVDACYHQRTGALRIDVNGAGCGGAEQEITLGGGSALATRIVKEQITLPEDGFGSALAECGEGEVVLGGGFELASINPDTAIVTNAPLTLDDDRQGWLVTMNALGPVPLTAFAVCAPGSSG